MNKSEVLAFLGALGCENIQTTSGDWVRASCPLAPWFHSRGKDSRPSFGVKVGTESENAVYHCFSCGSSGPLPRLMHNLTWLSGVQNDAAATILMSSGLALQEDTTRTVGRRRIRVHDKYATNFEKKRLLRNESVPKEVLERFPRLDPESDNTDVLEAVEWLHDVRKIDHGVIKKYKLRLFTDKVTGELGIIFPILSRDGRRVLDMWVRMVREKAFFRLNSKMTGVTTDYRAPNKWFGNHLYDAEKPCMLVEGPLDAMRLVTLGVSNVLASCGPPSAEQLATISGRIVHVAFDSDDAGRKFAKRAVRALSAPVITCLDWSVVGIKDAGDLEDFNQLKRAFNSGRTRIEKEIAAPRDKKKKDEKAPTLTFDPYSW